MLDAGSLKVLLKMYTDSNPSALCIFLVGRGVLTQLFKMKFQLKMAWYNNCQALSYIHILMCDCFLMLRGWFWAPGEAVLPRRVFMGPEGLGSEKWDTFTLKAVWTCGVGLFSEFWKISNRIWTFGTKNRNNNQHPQNPCTISLWASQGKIAHFRWNCNKSESKTNVEN